MPQNLPQFTPWETATHVPQSSVTGMLTRESLTPLSLLAALVITLLLWSHYGIGALAIGLIFGRLLALDLTTYTLPNIYTVPLMVVGLVHSLVFGGFLQAVLALVILLLVSLVLSRSHIKIGMGGGDLKLLAALFAFLPLTDAFFAIALGSLCWLPVAFLKPKASIPFGVPILLGWVCLLAFTDLPNWLISTIS
ncbi:MAG: prepilin peptidase [Blastochloris viridis]|uniref:Prepilin peptidase n=1 Tax=Blastochloris viridis TaxID=1079 RepID=A0A6N4RC00_BLAVI|nr:MAG: prepilin peptidase [Blastochloris viridis]